MMITSNPLLCFLLIQITKASVPIHQFVQERAASTTKCQNTQSALDPICWDVLNMDSWMRNWNITTKTCNPNERWANCFMRKAGMQEGEDTEGIGCAQVGPNTCTEPTIEAENSASATVEMRYGAYSIWSLQQYMTSIYDYLQSPTGLANIQSTYATINDHDVTGRHLFADLLFSEGSRLANTLGLIVSTNITVPEAEIALTEASQAPKALGQVLAAYLESFMTNFTLGGFSTCAKHGMLMRNQTFGA